MLASKTVTVYILK